MLSSADQELSKAKSSFFISNSKCYTDRTYPAKSGRIQHNAMCEKNDDM
jgi:hypothetical protein